MLSPGRSTQPEPITMKQRQLPKAVPNGLLDPLLFDGFHAGLFNLLKRGQTAIYKFEAYDAGRARPVECY